jgi:CheY-like chemotaxis protein
VSRTVLVVEDDADLRDTMRDILHDEGYTVLVASEGQEALAAMARADGVEDPVCMVLLDLVMPGMNGWDFVEALRAQDRFASVPVIVHTSSPLGAPADVARVLQKPLDIDGLIAVVREFCPQ